MTDPDPNQHLQRYFKLQHSDLAILEDLIAENLSGLFSFLKNQTSTLYNVNDGFHELFPDDGVLKRLMKYEKMPPASMTMCQDISTNPLLLTLAESGGFDEKTVDAILYLINKLDRNLRENRFEFVSFIEDHYIDDSCHYWTAFEEDEDEEMSLFTPNSKKKTKSLPSSGFFGEEESDRQRVERRQSSIHSSSSPSSSSMVRSVSTGSRDIGSFPGSDDGVEENRETDDSNPIKLLLRHWPEISKYCASFSQTRVQSQVYSNLNNCLVAKYEEDFRPRRAASDMCSVMFPKKAEEQGETSRNDFSTYRLEEEVEDEVALAASFVRTGFQVNSSLPVLRSWSELLSPPHSHNYDSVADQFFTESLRQKRKRSIAALLTSSSSSTDPLVSTKRLKQIQQNHHINSFCSGADSPIPVASHHPAAWKIGPRPSLLEAQTSSGQKNPFESLHPAFIAVSTSPKPAKEENNNKEKAKLPVSATPLHLLQLALERLEHHLERFEARNIARLTSVYSQCSQEIFTDAALASSSRLPPVQDVAGSILMRLQESCIRLLRHNEPKQSGRVIYPKRPVSALPSVDSTVKSVGKNYEAVTDSSSRQRLSTHRHSVTSLSLQETIALSAKSSESRAKDSGKRSFTSVSSENDVDESPKKKRVLSSVSLPTSASSATALFIGGVCDTRHFPRNYDTFLSKLKPGDVIAVRMKKDPQRRLFMDKPRKRRAVILQLKKDVECVRYVKVKFLSSESAEQRKSTASTSVSAFKGSMQVHAMSAFWIAVEDVCLEPLPVSSIGVPKAQRELLLPPPPPPSNPEKSPHAESVHVEVAISKDLHLCHVLDEPLSIRPSHISQLQPQSRSHPPFSRLQNLQTFLPRPAPFSVQESPLPPLPPSFSFYHAPRSPRIPPHLLSHQLLSHMNHPVNGVPLERGSFAQRYLPPQQLPLQQNHPRIAFNPSTLPSHIYLKQQQATNEPSLAYHLPLTQNNNTSHINNNDNNNDKNNNNVNISGSVCSNQPHDQQVNHQQVTTHSMLQIRSPAILQQRLFPPPNLPRVIPTFPTHYQSLPAPSPNLETFRLLPGGQLRKNNSSLNSKIL